VTTFFYFSGFFCKCQPNERTETKQKCDLSVKMLGNSYPYCMFKKNIDFILFAVHQKHKLNRDFTLSGRAANETKKKTALQKVDHEHVYAKICINSLN
jgi:hypothetical protein